MQYFIMLPGDTSDDAMSSTNILGEESLGKFIYDEGFKVLNNIINNHPDIAEHISIRDERGKYYEIEDFLDLVATWKIYR